MADPISAISGVISGINYRDLVDQIIAVESQPAVVARNREKLATSQLTALTTYRGLLDSLTTAAKAFRDGSAFDEVSASSGNLTLLTATATPSAVAANYTIGVTHLALAQKLGSDGSTSLSTPVGAVGTFTVNGKAVTVEAGDTLVDIRDRINALNTGADASKVSATIITVSPTLSRLVLTSQTTGAAGMTLADTSGTALQFLGFLAGDESVAGSAVIQAGQDAEFSIDGMTLTRSTNVVSDAIDGVTLTLTGESATTTQLAVARSVDQATARVQAFVDAYNKVVDFLQQQGTTDPKSTPPPLYGENIVRLMRARLPELLLSGTAGAATDLDTPGRAGVSLDKTGHLTFNTEKFTTLFQTRLGDLRQLFQQTGAATGAGLDYVSSSIDSKAGSYDVNITQVATQSSVAGAGLTGGVYVDDGAADTMTVTDTRLGKSTSIALTNGMTAAQIVDALNTAFGTDGLGLTATENAGQVTLSQGAYGSASGITVAYTAGGTQGSGPVAAGSYATGLDVAGTIGGSAATGSGQVLLGSPDSTARGVVIRYAGAVTGAIGAVTVTLGTGATIERLLTAYTQPNTGTVAQMETSLNQRIDDLEKRATRIDDREVLRRDTLLKQFAAMESALANFQNQSRAVLALLNTPTGTSSGGSK